MCSQSWEPLATLMLLYLRSPNLLAHFLKSVQMRSFKTSEFTKLPTGITHKGWAQGMHTRVVGSSVSAYPHPRHSDFLIKLHLLNTKVQRTDLRPVSPELPYCKNAHLYRLKPPSLWQFVRVAPENQPAATCYHTGGRQQGRDAGEVNCFRDDDTVLSDA